MSKTAFERYAPFIQEYIYRKGWTDLREVQVEACEAILDTDKHVIIASGTASGKTEAAFFPVLTSLACKPSKSVGILYIGPLKALINDQFERLQGLLEDSGIPVWPWHGDVSQSMKNRARKEAQGVLQITPESLEALLMSRPGDAAHMFSDLRFVIIDEIHALMGTDRGLQTLCLLARLERTAECKPRRIGLSATLNDYEPAKVFLAAGSDRQAIAVGIRHHQRTVSLCIESFSLTGEPEHDAGVTQEHNEFVYDACHVSKCLIFTNSRGKAEAIISDMKAIAHEQNAPDVFHVHHGSVSAALRQEAEAALREKQGPSVAAATLTLELGIDIGDLDSTIQLGAPFSCASFVQRLGRSGRRSGKSQMLFVELQEPSGDNLYEYLPWELLRAIAIIQLYLEERWVEPFDLKPKPFSLLAHQTLSLLMTYGEMSAADLARQALTLPAFMGRITQDEYRILLRHMLEKEYIERLENGVFIVGLAGERLTNHYSFYAVFQDSQAYRVRSKESEVGTLDQCPEIGEVFVLAGRSWKTIDVDEERKLTYVVPVKSKRIPFWNGSGGHIHSRIVQRMRQVLIEDTQYAYLRPNAQEYLREARAIARETGVLDSHIIQHTEQSFFLFPWVGSKALLSIKKLLCSGLGGHLMVSTVYGGSSPYLEVRSALSAERFREVLHTLPLAEFASDRLIVKHKPPQTDKYDALVPDELLLHAYVQNELDIAEAVDVLRMV